MADTFSLAKDTTAMAKKKNFGDYCTEDYLMIPQGFGDNAAITYDKWCGSDLLRPGPQTPGVVSCKHREEESHIRLIKWL